MGGDPTDVALVARLVAGDERALGLVYDRHAGLVYGLARRVTGDEQLAREITQDVFCHLWSHPDKVDPDRGSLRAYLGVVTHRRAVDAVRRSEARSRAESRSATAAPPVDDGADAPVVDAAAADWRATRIRQVLDVLPDEQRAALLLAYFEGCTYREVARRLDIPEGTAKSRLRLALARLREQLEHDDRLAWT
jgi:RNA polymerase sigma-70 factor, ECF subfamily